MTRDRAAFLGAQPDGVNRHALLSDAKRGLDRLGAEVLAVAEQNDRPTLGFAFGQQLAGDLQAASDRRALVERGRRRQVAGDSGRRLVVVSKRETNLGVAGKDHQAQAVALELGEQRPDFLPGAAEPVGFEVACVHAQRRVDDDDNVCPAAYRLRLGRPPARLSDGHGQETDRRGEQRPAQQQPRHTLGIAQRNRGGQAQRICARPIGGAAR